MIRITIAVIALWSSFLSANDRFSGVEVKATPLSDSVYMLVGSGGNIGVSVGPDGVLVIDDQYRPLAKKIDAAISGLSNSKIRYVINTHYHGDHTGSNDYFREVKDATIFAHDNVRIRLEIKDGANAKSLPVVTYDKGIKFHMNGDTIHVIHVANSHTDGDSYVWFEKQNILHTGDLMFEGRFPYIDLKAGGNVDGFIGSIEFLLSMVNDETQIIPGHGKLANKKDLEKYLNMLQETNAAVRKDKSAGMSLEAIIEKGLDDKWKDWGWEFINEKFWITTLYNGS